MQKKLLTVAVASALAAPAAALAQSSVEVYGFVNMSVGHVKYDGGATPNVSKWDVASHASNYGVRGRESLGGGLTAWFQIENNAPMERSNNVAITPASRNSAVGIQGGFGNVFIGQWTTPWADLDALWSVGTVGGWGPVTSIIGRRETTGTAPNPNCVNGHLSGGTATTATAPVCDAIEAGASPFWRRISQAVFYQSPVMAGVQAKLAYQTNESKATAGITTNANPYMWSASVQWSGMGGRARVGAAYDSHKDFGGPGTNDKGWAVKGGWNFGVVDVGLAYEKVSYDTLAGDADGTQYGVAVAVPIGGNFIRGSWAKAKTLTGAGAVAGSAAHVGSLGGAKTWNLGYEHRFSKRTSVGVGYAKIDNEATGSFVWTGLPPNANGQNVAGAAGQDVSTFFVNVVHRF
jgi:predicted porin